MVDLLSFFPFLYKTKTQQNKQTDLTSSCCFITLLQHPSYRQVFLGLCKNYFSHPRDLNVVCDDPRKNQVERVATKLYSSFIMPRKKEKLKMYTNARLGLAAGETSLLMPNGSFGSKTPLLIPLALIPSNPSLLLPSTPRN